MIKMSTRPLGGLFQHNRPQDIDRQQKWDQE
jgi:hypothetical protein